MTPVQTSYAVGAALPASWRTVRLMCRNIRVLHNYQPPATEHEIHDAALQYVRKIAGTRDPSRANQDAFATAVSAVEAATAALLDSLVATAPPKNREDEAAKAKMRNLARFG